MRGNLINRSNQKFIDHFNDRKLNFEEKKVFPPKTTLRYHLFCL